jgi:putative membrane protein
MSAAEFRLRRIGTALLVTTAAITVWTLGARFDLPRVPRAVLVLAATTAAFAAARSGYQALFVVTAGSTTILSALGASFGAPYTGDSPVRLDVVLGPWAIAGATALLTGGALLLLRKGVRFGAVLFLMFVLVWVILSINVHYFGDWALENALTVPFALLMLFTYDWFRLSRISYAAVYLFMCLHVTGTHYTYSEVPLGAWVRDALVLQRNHYDRVVHFLFGLLLVYPMREVVVRIGELRGFWGIWVPVQAVLASSAIYEIIEWIIADVFGDVGIAYLGTQGDEWDPIKDMALAWCGACITMAVVLATLLALHGRAFRAELRESLQVRRRTPLGEVELERARGDE